MFSHGRFGMGMVGRKVQSLEKESERILQKAVHHGSVNKTLYFAFKLCRTVKSVCCSP